MGIRRNNMVWVYWRDFTGEASNGLDDFQQDAGEGNDTYLGWEVEGDYESNGWGYISKHRCDAIDKELLESGFKTGEYIHINISW